MMRSLFLSICSGISMWLLLAISFQARAQDNYEIQVYGAQTVDKGSTMVELHSNFTFAGTTTEQNGVLPTHDMDHETIEITHGFTDWFETGFYFFNALGSDGRSAYVGSHIRPRVMIPAKWNWPMGVSLSVEGGYQKRAYSEDDWTLEIRPIVDKTAGNFYIAFNPTFDRSLHGLNVKQGFVFSPNLKTSYNVTKVWALGVEYYGSIGPLNELLPFQQQQQQLFLAADATFSPVWEFNIGYGWGFTRSTDNAILKMILGYRFK